MMQSIFHCWTANDLLAVSYMLSRKGRYGYKKMRSVNLDVIKHSTFAIIYQLLT